VLNIYLLCIILPFVLVYHSPLHWIMGGAFGLLAPMGVSWGFYKWKGKVGLGGGDIKLWGVLGIYLGLQGVIENIFYSCFVGSIVGLGLIFFKKYDHDGGIPFGPFIILVAFFQIYLPSLLDLVRIF
jgi:prepilin signal peptidase PulO-like enzyme (type II secretory pathway)